MSFTARAWAGARGQAKPFLNTGEPAGFMVDITDLPHIANMTSSFASFSHMTKLVFRFLFDRLRYPRGTRLTMGNALAGGLLKGALDAKIELWREAAVVEPAAVQFTDQKAAKALLEGIAARDREMTAALEKDWDDGRPADSLAKSEALFGLQPKDQLLYQWRRAAAYSASLAANPERFQQLTHPFLGTIE